MGVANAQNWIEDNSNYKFEQSPVPDKTIPISISRQGIFNVDSEELLHSELFVEQLKLLGQSRKTPLADILNILKYLIENKDSVKIDLEKTKDPDTVELYLKEILEKTQNT